MEHIIAKLLRDFDHGKMTRRQLIQSLTLAATAASTAGAVPALADSQLIKATKFNHVSYQVADYARTRDFYVSLFGMQVSRDDGKHCYLTFGDSSLIPHTSPSGTPRIDHIAYTVANWDSNKEQVEAELKHRGLKVLRGDTKLGFTIEDPDGFEVELTGPRQ